MEFKEKLLAVVNSEENNDARSAKFEKALLEAAEEAGVVRLHRKRIPSNPNRVGKFLAPWFNDECR